MLSIACIVLCIVFASIVLARTLCWQIILSCIFADASPNTTLQSLFIPNIALFLRKITNPPPTELRCAYIFGIIMVNVAERKLLESVRAICPKQTLIMRDIFVLRIIGGIG